MKKSKYLSIIAISIIALFVSGCFVKTLFQKHYDDIVDIIDILYPPTSPGVSTNEVIVVSTNDVTGEVTTNTVIEVVTNIPPVVENPTNTVETSPDAIPLDQIVWKHQNVSQWSITATLKVSFPGNNVRIDYDKAGVWPKVSAGEVPIVGNPWIFIKNPDGKWYGCTWEWLKPNQIEKPRKVVNGAHIKVSPYNGDWKPTSGTEYGWMVSAPARGGGLSTVKERTPIVMAIWP